MIVLHKICGEKPLATMEDQHAAAAAHAGHIANKRAVMSEMARLAAVTMNTSSSRSLGIMWRTRCKDKF